MKLKFEAGGEVYKDDFIFYSKIDFEFGTRTSTSYINFFGQSLTTYDII